MPKQYRAVFDAEISFSNGGGIRAEGFRVDVASPEATAQEVGALFVASLGLLMTDTVRFDQLEIVEEQHKGTRGGPSDPATAIIHDAPSVRRVDLSQVVRSGQTTYPGLPAPLIEPHLTREASRSVYAEGTEFQIDRITMLGNTGTYLDSPLHRYAAGLDLAGLALEQLVDLPAIVVRTAGAARRAVDVGQLAAFDVRGCAVLLHTGGDRAWGTPEYALDAPHLTADAAQWLVEHGAALVGIDSVNIDAIDAGRSRPAHSILLGAGIPVVEHLTGLAAVPPLGALFTAVPPRVANFGTFPVRAFATIRA